jgi:hypothetical protein
MPTSAGEEGEGPGEEGEAEGRITINSSLPALQLYGPVYIYRTVEVPAFLSFNFALWREKMSARSRVDTLYTVLVEGEQRPNS